MDPTVQAVLGISMRWIHIASVTVLLGSFVYARYVAAPALASLAAPARETFEKQALARFRPLLYTALSAIVASGLYNYLTKAAYPAGYHMWIGIKFLLVLHIFAVSILYTLPGAGSAKRARWLTGMVVSGLAIVALSGWLRWISLAH